MKMQLRITSWNCLRLLLLWPTLIFATPTYAIDISKFIEAKWIPDLPQDIAIRKKVMNSCFDVDHWDIAKIKTEIGRAIAEYRSKPTAQSLFPILCYESYFHSMASKYFKLVPTEEAKKFEFPATYEYARAIFCCDLRGFFGSSTQYHLIWKLAERVLKADPKEPSSRSMIIHYSVYFHLGTIHDDAILQAESLLRDYPQQDENLLSLCSKAYLQRYWRNGKMADLEKALSYAKRVLDHPQAYESRKYGARETIKWETPNLKLGDRKMKTYFDLPSPKTRFLPSGPVSPK